MSVHYTLPQSDDFARLAEERQFAVTIAVPTSPVVAEREVSRTAAKSAFDRASGILKERGARHAERARFDDEWDALADDEQLWGNLAESLVIFAAPGFSDVFVLPNRLESQLQVADHFDVGQLLRAVTFRQQAYALLLSANEWSLWFASASARAARVDVSSEHPGSLDEAMSRDPLLPTERKAQRIGDPDLTQELELYVKRVSDAVGKELARRDREADGPLFAFAAEPIISMLLTRGVLGHAIVPVHGAPDRLGAAEIDAAIRDRLATVNAEQAQRRIDAIADESGAGLVVAELSDIAAAAAAGAVDTLVFAFGVDVDGRFDEATGAIEFASTEGAGVDGGPHTYDLLSRIAVTVVQRGGSVLAVRPDEVASPVWNGVSLALLRYALT